MENVDPSPPSEALRARIESVLDGMRPRLHLDGADVILVSLSPDGVLCIRMTGRHAGCPMAVATLQSCIAGALHDFPAVKQVVAVKA